MTGNAPRNALAEAALRSRRLSRMEREALAAAAETLAIIAQPGWLDGMTEADRAAFADFVRERAVWFRRALPRMRAAARAVLEAAERAVSQG